MSVKKLAIINVVLFAMIIGLGGILFVLYQDPAPQPRALNAIPYNETGNITVPQFGMDGLSHADFEGKLLVLNMFASWCVPCEAEHPIIKSLATDHGLPLYGIAVLDEKEKTDAFLDRLGNPYLKFGHDINGLLYQRLGGVGVPETMIIDGLKNEVIWRHRGPLTHEIVEQELLPAFTDQNVPD